MTQRIIEDDSLVGRETPEQRDARLQYGLNPEQRKRLSEFGAKKQLHSKATETLKELVHACSIPGDKKFLVLIGAPGSGKTTLSKSFIGKLFHKYAAAMERDKSVIPYVRVVAREASSVYDAYLQILVDLVTALGQPVPDGVYLLDKKGGKAISSRSPRNKIPALEMAVVTAFKQRRCEVALIDESFHMLHFKKAEQDYLANALKSLMNVVETKLLLVGSFDMLDLMTTNGQIFRRSNIFCLERYDPRRKGDKEAFVIVLRGFMSIWPCAEIPRFDLISDYLLSACLGCVGLLSEILLEFAAQQLAAKGERWTPEFLRRGPPSKEFVASLAAEILEGEKKVRNALHSRTIWSDGDVKRMGDLMAGITVEEA